MARKAPKGIRERESHGRPFNASEVIAYLRDFGVQVDRRYTAAELIQRIMNRELEDLSNTTDALRERLLAWVHENWDTVRHYIDCPLEKDKERGCYQCSDGLAASCYFVNKRKIEGSERSDDDESL
jgi:hypothetical protein